MRKDFKSKGGSQNDTPPGAQTLELFFAELFHPARQLLTKELPGAVEPGLDRFCAAADRGGNFLLALLLILEKQNDGSEIVGTCLDGVAHGAGEVFALRAVGRRVITRFSATSLESRGIRP